MNYKKLISLFSLVVMLGISSIVNAEQLTPAQQAQFEGIVQHYCFVSENLFIKVRKVKDNTLYISDNNKESIDYAHKEFKKNIDAVRYKFYNKQQSNAVDQFASHMLNLCNKFNLKRYYVLGFPFTADEYDFEQKLDLLNQANKALEKFYESIKPYPPLLKQLENALLYNFVSTKIVPKIISLSGPFVSAWWLGSKLIKGKDNPFSAIRTYKKIVHNSYESIGEDFLAQFFAAATGRTGGYCPCSHTDEGHVCKAPDDGNCYKDTGFEKNPAKIAFKVAPKLDFFAPYFVMKYVGQSVEEFQLPEYNRRIKQQNDAVDQKKVEREMRNLKVQYEKDIDFGTIKGQKNLIESEIRMIVDYLKHPFKYKRDNGSLSILFYGPPGNGKTLLARSIAKESGAPFLEINADDMLHPDAKEKILAIWRMAERVASERNEKSAIIYMDEIDNVVGNRKNGQLDPVRAKALANLLSILDGIEKRNPYIRICIIICTNHHKNLDEALMRPGRIDHKIHITVPDEQGRLEFFDMLIPRENRHLIPDLVARTAGLSGAEIQNMVANAEMISQYNNRAVPLASDYERSLENMLRQKAETKN